MGPVSLWSQWSGPVRIPKCDIAATRIGVPGGCDGRQASISRQRRKERRKETAKAATRSDSPGNRPLARPTLGGLPTSGNGLERRLLQLHRRA